ncbi:MAG: tRNA uridine-5-carboxymethylaminomethyl(34) synthesis GTPase MnmE [Alphaproteobacteria bacterium]|nr:tRNA uridine-5-carboxymethylaminomethyl(34) synthesis GTPase MnmE [Alphaproteobacteria bacterium]HPF47136.1 tRNA uridine-5-carboxymethylaminomethyl(34) synthesis GTPase MnmE [Emcibacteraceae bacterium]HRW29124.1 tRNA uridine-5-carboxymethylaminomethyl(34) synthesis GTPase MnmE [Emcibacteraceae bacterium]
MTIFALSSGKGRAGVSVIRLSGPLTEKAILLLTKKQKCPEARKAMLTWFYDPSTGERLDQGILIFFQGPNSFTGEDVAEFHIHGGYAVTAGFLEALSKINGLRSAEAGEFTRRAFDNGKMDLTSAEGLADLINAETSGQRKQALRQMEGELANLYEGWRKELITAMAYLEADIDFSDEEIPDDVGERVRPVIEKLYAEIEKHLADGHRGERLRHGLQVIILGAPNAGKSSLMNYLSKRDVAIVSDIAGTTRDLLEVHLDISGFPVSVIDTAGIRYSDNEIESEGIRRAEVKAADADLKIVVIDGTQDHYLGDQMLKHIDENTMILINKVDLLDVKTHSEYAFGGIGVWSVSAKTRQGLDDFMTAFEREVSKRMELTDTPSLTRTRHRANLQSALKHMKRYVDADHFALELQSEDLRMAARDIGKITGYVDVEDILEKIFKEFCIGK